MSLKVLILDQKGKTNPKFQIHPGVQRLKHIEMHFGEGFRKFLAKSYVQYEIMMQTLKFQGKNPKTV